MQGAPTPKSPVSRRICRKSRQMRPGIPGGTAQKPGDTAQKPGDTTQILGGTAQMSGGTAQISGGTAQISGGTAQILGGTAQIPSTKLAIQHHLTTPECLWLVPRSWITEEHHWSDQIRPTGPSELLPVLRAPPTGI